jgi:chromosomal replication initiator protein
MDNLWNKAKEGIRRQVSDQEFSIWIDPIRYVSCDRECLTLGVPNQFHQTMIERHYLAPIMASLQESSDFYGEIAIAVNDKKVDPSWDFPEGESGLISETSSGVANDQGEQSGEILATAEAADKLAPLPKQPLPSYSELIQNNIRKNEEKRRQREIDQLNDAAAEVKPQAFNPKYTFDNFVVGECNRFVHAASFAIANNTANYNPLFIYGGVGLGKTHLLRAIGNAFLAKNPRMKVFYLSSEMFTNELIKSIRENSMHLFREKYRNSDVLLIDDIQFIEEKERTQEEFFHTFNTLYESNKQIAIASDRTPKNFTQLQERLRSRFEWGLIADIQPPDLETKIAILEKRAREFQLHLPDDVKFYIAANIQANIRELVGSLMRIGALSDLENRRIDIDLVKEVLTLANDAADLSIEAIQARVCKYFKIGTEDLLSSVRNKEVVLARQIGMYLARELTKESFPAISIKFGRKDHTTTIHACKQVRKKMMESREFAKMVTGLEKELKNFK